MENSVGVKFSVEEVKVAINQLKSITKELIGMGVQLGSTTNAFSNLGKKIVSIGKDLKTQFIDKAIDASEELNLFNVAFNNIEKNGKTMFSELGQKATQFQNQMNEAFGTNIKETMRYQGLFQSMGKSAGISEELSDVMSENMLKLTYDLASLYNTTETRAAESLRAGVYAGQTKPLRSYGIDITQQSYKPILEDLGIEKSVSELSQGEKEILRYIATLKQAQTAMGDFANTIESPANQLKILKQQFYEMQVAIGNLFVGAFAKILPYVNAIIMVIKELAKAIASLFGIEMKDYNTGIASYGDDWEDYGDYIDGVGDNASSTSKKLKELKRQTLGFDQINNLTSPTKNSGSGSSGSGIVSGGIDKRLLEAIKGYSNGMEEVRMKATQIRDKIMEWLGFTKYIDSETGKVGFKFDHITGGTVLGALAVGGVIFKGVKNIFDFLKKIGLINFGKIEKLKTLTKNIKDYFEIIGGVLTGKISTGATTLWGKLKEIHSFTFGMLSPLGKVVYAISNVVGLLLSLKGIFDSVENFVNDGPTILNVLGGISGEVGAIVSGFALLGPGGAIAGGIAGILTGIISYVQRKEDLEELNKLFDGQGISIETISNKLIDAFDNSTKYIGNIETLANEYETAKTKVDSAREELDKFQQSLELQDGKITSSQISELKSHYDNVKQATKEANDSAKNYYLSLIKYNGFATQDTEYNTAEQIASYNRLASAKNGYDQEYLDKEEKLTLARNLGKISVEEYHDKIKELKMDYGYLAADTVNAQGVIDSFSKTLSDIDYGSPEQATESIKAVQDEYNTTIKQLDEFRNLLGKSGGELDENAKKQLENLETTKTLQGGLNETQQKIYDTLKGLQSGQTEITENSIKSVESTIENIQGQYKGFLASIYADLSSRGLESSTEFKSTCSEIKSELKKLEEVDMTGFGKEMFDGMISSIEKEKPEKLIKIKGFFDSVGVDGGESFNTAVKNQMSGIYNSMIDGMGDKAIIPKQFKEIGEDSNDGFKEGLIGPQAQTKTQKTADTFREITEGAVRNSLDTHSPSKVFEKIGIDTIDGLILGIDESTQSVIDTLKKLISKMKKEFDSVIFEFKISTNVENSFNSILSKLQTFTDKFRSGINSLLSGMKSSMNGIKVDGSGKITYSSMPKISVSKFANGGMPEDGFFFANHSELVGKFANGRTAVANNEQIIAGIERGVYNAVTSAMSNGNYGSVDIQLHTDEGVIVDRINKITRQTGTCPINI